MVPRLTKLFKAFYESEKTGGYLLMGCAALALILANSSIGSAYLHFWEKPLFGGPSIHFWINDGLMAVFFLLVGLEIEREFYSGELSDWRNALVPLFAAIGGMALPAMTFYFYNAGLPSIAGFGIPMATDIAFAIGVLALLGDRVPIALKVFLTALAIIDDLGAIVIIALFYAHGFSWLWFGLSVAIIGLMLLLNLRRVFVLWPYLLLGAGLWHTLHNTGIHATIAGVITALAIPYGDGKDRSPSYQLQHALHHPVAYLIVPLFALANAGLVLSPDVFERIGSPLSMGIIIGLMWGKPMGVLLGAVIGRIIGGQATADAVGWWQYTGAGILSGIGFTMSIFISLLALDNSADVDLAKAAVFLASIGAGVLGFSVLKLAGKS